MDFLAQHISAELYTGGNLQKLSCANLPAAKMKPPNIFSSGLANDARLNAIKSCFMNPTNKEFVRLKIKRLLEEGIIQESSSPWQAQAFVLRDGNPEW